MNDLIEKVKQGLKCCTGLGCHHGCKYHGEPIECGVRLRKDALSVIEYLQTENKILSENCDGLAKQRDDFAQTIHEQKMEIERMKAEVEKAYVSGQNNMLEAQAEGR